MTARPHPSSPESMVDRYESDLPARSSMRGDLQNTRNPSTDQKNVRRRLRQKTSAEDSRMTLPTQADVTELRRAAARATTLDEQQYLMGEAERADKMIRQAQNAERDTDLGAKVANDLLTPARVHEMNTPATDWLSTVASAGTDRDPAAEMTTQANLWYDRCHVAVKADDHEFDEQARGMARRHAGAHGERAQHAEDTFLSRVAHLRQRDVASGRITRVATSAAEGNAGPMVPAGAGAEATSSSRAKNIEQLQNNPSQDLTSVNDPGLGQTNDIASQMNGPSNPQQDVGKTGSRRIARGNNEGGTSDDFYGGDRGGPHYEDHPDSFAKEDAEHRKFMEELNNDDARSHYSSLTSHGGSMPEDLKKKINDESNGDPDAPDPDNDNDNPFADSDDDSDDDDKKSKDKKSDKDDDSSKKESSMQTAPCPACSGRGKVAVRAQGVSGLPQIDQMVDNHDNGPEQTAYPEQVAFPLVGWDPNNVNRTIQETEQQLQQRDKLKGAARQAALHRLAALKGVQAYQREQAQRQAAQNKRANPWAFIAGQDDSGWIGDMGAGGVGPGQQDGGNPGGPNNIEVPDPVYGYGGDTQQSGANKPYGADEANDRTNQPPNWQIGQPTQMDRGTVNPAGLTNDAGAPPFPNPPQNKNAASQRQAFLDSDPELIKARKFAQQRVAMFDEGRLPEYQD